jgi:hypothetical protein
MQMHDEEGSKGSKVGVEAGSKSVLERKCPARPPKSDLVSNTWCAHIAHPVLTVS